MGIRKNRLDLTIDEVVLERGLPHVDKDVLRKDIEREVTRLMTQGVDLQDLAASATPSIAEQAARQIVRAISDNSKLPTTNSQAPDRPD